MIWNTYLKNDASGVKLGHLVPEKRGVTIGTVTCQIGHVPSSHWSGACQVFSCLKQNQGCLENGAATIAAVPVVGCFGGLSPPGLAPNRYRITIGPRYSQSCGHPPPHLPQLHLFIFITTQSFQRTLLYLRYTIDRCEPHTTHIL